MHASLKADLASIVQRPQRRKQPQDDRSAWALAGLRTALKIVRSPGEFIAIIGTSGSGKTTLTQEVAELCAGQYLDCGCHEVSSATVIAAREAKPALLAFDEPSLDGVDGALMLILEVISAGGNPRVVVVLHRPRVCSPSQILASLLVKLVGPARATVFDLTPGEVGVSWVQKTEDGRIF